ncbi:hypothetical protein ABW20_dc0109229 [Dactylellina cionopaga]|nr:hypothetical protein ABW20_dc0109229 [Dactylellina cionopaga]
MSFAPHLLLPAHALALAHLEIAKAPLLQPAPKNHIYPPYLASISTKSSPEIGPSFPTTKATKTRGRGLPGASAMDARFDPSYDPTLDIVPSNREEEDDWEAALEAVRDRQKWKQQGKERLKAAGFDDDFITAWETNTIKDERRIKWSKDKGGRDWDRGKVVDEETGEVKLKASWG